MLLKKFLKNRRKLKIIVIFIIIALIIITLVILNSAQSESGERFNSRAFSNAKLEQPPILLKSPQYNGVIVPEKYDEHKVKVRIIEEKIKSLQQQQSQPEPGDEHTTLSTLTQAVHIFYTAPVQWYKTKKSGHPLMARQTLIEENKTVPTTTKPLRILNTAFYPALGLYKPTTSLLQKHLENINNCGVGVIILPYTGKPCEQDVYKQILDLVPSYNLSVTFELSVAGNQSLNYLRQQLLGITKYAKSEGFYRVYSQSLQRYMPVVYISNAYKLSESESGVGRLMCRSHPDSIHHTFDAYFIGHIRLKSHAETMRRLCFEGFYSKLPSNGATFASTWKNWSYLKSFATTYKMLFVPTVGPGFAERNKFPRHGDIQRHRSNGRYYGVAWRTAIVNHVGFINIASYNNWPDGSQIEEVMPKAGFLDYNPGSKTKYLDLTAHWVGNFMKTRFEAAVSGIVKPTCYELLNNTIC